MCGIAGILKYNGQQPQEETLKQMTGAMNHRGPDHEGSGIDSTAIAAMMSAEEATKIQYQYNRKDVYPASE